MAFFIFTTAKWFLFLCPNWSRTQTTILNSARFSVRFSFDRQYDFYKMIVRAWSLEFQINIDSFIIILNCVTTSFKSILLREGVDFFLYALGMKKSINLFTTPALFSNILRYYSIKTQWYFIFKSLWITWQLPTISSV